MSSSSRSAASALAPVTVEIEVDYAQWTFLKNRLCELIDPEQDSLRFYYLGKSWQSKVEHVGAKPVIDLNGPLIL